MIVTICSNMRTELLRFWICAVVWIVKFRMDKAELTAASNGSGRKLILGRCESHLIEFNKSIRLGANF
ncbi:hypothetical protein [Ruegeria meonggei]|uniref:hypothetical protein n=1 Tax=Ruegeria meonggei TaxID=1446476 RepID=UPI00366DBB01